MKKSFLSVFAFACALTVAAYAQDDYEEYAPGQDDYADNSYMSSDEDVSTAKSSYSYNVETVSDQKEVDKIVSGSGDESSSVKKLRFGGHFALGYSGTYGNEKAAGLYYNPQKEAFEIGEKDPFDGFLGLNMDIGFMIVYHINNQFAIAPEFNLHFIDYFKESDVWYVKIHDRNGWYHNEPLDENMMLLDFSIPVMARFYASSNLFVEAGVQINLNLAGSFTLDNSEYDYSEDVGDWSGEFFGFGINAGFGYAVEKNGRVFELGARFMMDLTRLEADERVLNKANESYRDPVATKAWNIQVVLNYLI